MPILLNKSQEENFQQSRQNIENIWRILDQDQEHINWETYCALATFQLIESRKNHTHNNIDVQSQKAPGMIC